MPPPAGATVSDDRGYFRIWDLRPGIYELAMWQRGFAGPPVKLESRLIEIAPGETESQVRFTLKTDENVFSISGEIVGVEPESLERAGIAVQQTAEGRLWRSYFTLREGRFIISGLRKGEYVLRLTDHSSRDRRWSYLETLTLDRDLTGLELTPKPPTGVRGRVEFVDGEPSELSFAIGPPGNRGVARDFVQARGPEYEFEHTGLAPGEYEIGLRGQSFYLVERTTVTVQIGRMQELVLRVSNVRSTVRGTARVAEGAAREAAAHFTVVMRSGRERYKAQADESGAFVFENVIPGQYEIAAFESANADEHDDAGWERAGENRKRLTLEAGFDTEIDLTVTR
jgi:hypothetical protein